MADETKVPDPKAADTSKTKSKLKEAAKPEEGTVVEFSDKIWIEATGDSRHMKKGTKYEVNRTHGEKLISKGAAKETTAPPKPKPKPAAKKTNDDEEDD